MYFLRIINKVLRVTVSESHMLAEAGYCRPEIVRLLAIPMISAVAVTLLASLSPARAAVSVATYHNDNARTGWNQGESVLTPAAVGGSSFKLLKTIPLDEQVDGEPLYVAGQSITGQGIHDTVYVATEHNSIYAIDAQTGQVLLQTSLGVPVPSSQLPGRCPNSSAFVGINSTPVIDTASQTLYAITYNFGSGKPYYWLNALDLATLKPKHPRHWVTASLPLSDGKAYTFNPAVTRQRAALLFSKGNVYAAFTSFCDNDPSAMRGWVLGWRSSDLQLLDKELTNRLATSPSSYFLDTIWMSGYGPAADPNGNIFFVTGNSDPKNTVFYPGNLAESVVKMRYDLAAVQSFFTPGTAATGRAALELHDKDFGAGGVLVIPAQPGQYPRLAVAAGKVGTMYLMNRDSLGGYTEGADKVLGNVDIGACFCGPSYYLGADGIGRVVTSGGQQVQVWKIVTSPSAAPKLVRESISAPLNSGQDSGFFTSVASRGVAAGSQVIWALSRPSQTNSVGVNLYAFDPSTVSASGVSKTLFSGKAGAWPNGGANANLVPLVANGRVFVASYKQLSIFGLQSAATAKEEKKIQTPETASAEPVQPALPGHAVYGKLRNVNNAILTIETRTGAMLTVDSTAAIKAETSALPIPGRALLIRGDYDDKGILHATSISRVKDQPELWKKDR
jgi:outer membrane protein assembly factor BamB